MLKKTSSVLIGSMGMAQRSDRQRAVKDLKRALILDAARKVFEREGLEGASLRAIATAAG
ncbi:MAG TPA: TetR family transcriptional regulator, partial [Hyphomicrobiaceae bacterium]|nr:TetR family transcriptional regulator [Hyphomicrobiaceae bacterium]